MFQYELTATGATPQGRFLYFSERGPEVFGVPTAAVLADANALWNTIAVEDRRRMNQALRVSATTMDEWRSEFRLNHEDGRVCWLLATATPERMDPQRTVWHGYVEDITGRRLLDEARQDAAVAAAANHAKTEFLSRMSHELRTPLNAVLGFAQLMEMDLAEPPAPGQQRRLKLIREAGAHLLHMISDLLDLTRIEAGGMQLQIEPVPLRDATAQALELVRELADRAQVQLLLQPGPEFVVRADRTRLRQVLLNLLSNAIKYNRPGGRVELELVAGADGHADLRVSDTGLGIAEADLPHIFEPFHRGSHASSTVDGAGIGLAVTRALVQLMHGRIGARSQAGSGSVFTLGLPLSGAAAPTFEPGVHHS